MGGYPQNSGGNRPTPAGWTGAVANTASPAGGNGPGSSQPYPRRDPDEGSWFWGAVHGSEHFAESAYHAAAGVVQDAEETAIRVAHVAQAIYLASDYANDAVRDKIRMDVGELKKAFIPGLVMSLGILAITTLAGATVAGILVGVLTAGAGAIPAAVAGGELGLDAGFLILDAMGIGFLLREVFAGISQVFTMVKAAMETAWNAGSNPRRPPMSDIEAAANGLAGAAAEMVSLLLEGVLIWILAESAVARAGKLAQGAAKLSSPAALATRGSQVLSDLRAKPEETRATLSEGVAELAGILRRAGQLTRGLADFVEGKFEQILKNVTEDAGKQAEELKRAGAGGGGETEGNTVGRSPAIASSRKPPEPATTEAKLDQVYKNAPAAKQEIDDLAAKVAQQHGGTVAQAALKSRARAMEKINNDYAGDVSRIKDIARNTIVVPSGSEGAALQTLLKENPAIDPAAVKIVTPDSNPLGYSGINVTVPTQSGLRAEIQINPPEMIFAKEAPAVARSILGNDRYNQLASNPNLPGGGQGHVLYEQWRSLPEDSPKAQSIAEASRIYHDAFRK